MLQPSLRQRTTVIQNSTTNVADFAGREPFQNTGLTVRSMQRASPQHMGNVMKLQVSIPFTLLPRFLQRWILKLWFLSFLRPSWQPRYLILLGSYLYKFKNDRGDLLSQKPNGSPVRIDDINVHIVNSADRDGNDAVVAIHSFDNITHLSVFCVSTFRKNYYYACTNHDEAMVWVNTLREAHQEVITRTMGHASKDSFPSSWTYYDNLGKDLVERKDRIRLRLQQSNLRELEMSNLTEGGPIPRGYFG
jgi:PH domain